MTGTLRTRTWREAKLADPAFLFAGIVAQRDQIRDRATEASHGTKKRETAVLSEVPILVPPLKTEFFLSPMITDINSEDRLVQATFADHLHDVSGWDGVFARNQWTFEWPSPGLQLDVRKLAIGRRPSYDQPP